MTIFTRIGDIERQLLTDRPRRRFIIPDVLPVGPCLFYGASGSGKTGIGIRTAISVAAGLRWGDRAVVSGAVLYVAGEDVDGAKERMVAAALALGQDTADLPVAVMEAPQEGLVSSAARIAIAGAARELARQTDRQVALIIVDTLAACFGPKSQDDATAASEYMTHVDKTAREIGCAFLSIHHTGKNETAGMRGSRVFFDRADAVVEVKQGQSKTSFMKVEKMRNGPDGARFAFDITGHDVPTSEGPISVQVIRDLRPIEPETVSPDEAKQRRKQTIADGMLGILLRLTSGNEPVPVETWQDACYAMWQDKSDGARRKVFSTNRRDMESKGQIGIKDGIVTVTVTDKSEVTSPVTTAPDGTVTVTVTPPPFIGGEERNKRTGLPGSHFKADGAVVSVPDVEQGERIAKATAFDGGHGGKAPAKTSAAGNGNSDKRHGRTANA